MMPLGGYRGAGLNAHVLVHVFHDYSLEKFSFCCFRALAYVTLGRLHAVFSITFAVLIKYDGVNNDH